MACGTSTLSEEQGVSLDPFVREYCRRRIRKRGCTISARNHFGWIFLFEQKSEVGKAGFYLLLRSIKPSATAAG